MVIWLLLVALLLAGLGGWLLFRSRRLWRATGLPVGRVTYVDTGAWKHCEQPLFSARHRLTGRPDYLVKGARGWIPVEVKTARAPARPYRSHLLQLAAYCLLVEEQEGVAPPSGIIKYQDRAFEVDYTPQLRQEVLRTVEAMRSDLGAGSVGRSHEEAQRCRGCGYRGQCSERL